jgi:hypothetical protein
MNEHMWWVEYENGGQSTAYDSEAEAWAAPFEVQSSDQPGRPRWLCSSNGDRLVILIKDAA